MSATISIVALLLATVAGCGREEEQSSVGRTPIVETRLHTPKGTTRVKEALSAHTPKPSDSDEPIVHEEPTAKPKVAAVAPSPKPSDTAAEKSAPPAAEAMPARVAKKSVVGRGVELHAAPSGRVLGEFQGRTDIEVVEEREGWSRVRTATIDGDAIEGWVQSTKVGEPKAKIVAKAAAPSGDAEKPAAAPQAGSPAAPKAAAPKTAPAKKPAGKGPDNVTLMPIAGTEKKRPGTPFTHKAHSDDYSVKCESCHHPVKAKGGDVGSYVCSTAGCHTANECNGQAVAKKNKACPNFEDAYHIQCIDCHKKDGGPTKCAECHTG